MKPMGYLSGCMGTRKLVPARRMLAGLAEFNAQLSEFFARANHRCRRAMGCVPVDRTAALRSK